jgi:hypothetical protein
MLDKNFISLRAATTAKTFPLLPVPKIFSSIIQHSFVGAQQFQVARKIVSNFSALLQFLI